MYYIYIYVYIYILLSNIISSIYILLSTIISSSAMFVVTGSLAHDVEVVLVMDAVAVGGNVPGGNFWRNSMAD